ncbi:MAG: hypothetical protein ACI35O_15545 [Bacillaceae bacterium]
MKKYRWFVSILCIGFGFFYFASQQQLELFSRFFEWPSVLIIIGLACLCQAYLGKDQHYIIPGILLAGFGLHFHLSVIIKNYPNPIAVLIFIVALSLFLKNKRSKGDLLPSFLLLVISLFFFFSDQIDSAIKGIQFDTTLIQRFWPLLLVIFGIYLLFFSKKRY